MYCPISVPDGEICRYCNQLHRPYVVEIPQGWNKRDILIPMLIIVGIAIVGMFIWFNRTYIIARFESGNNIPDNWLGEGWHYTDGVWQFADM